jgi:hypothetical protein
MPGSEYAVALFRAFCVMSSAPPPPPLPLPSTVPAGTPEGQQWYLTMFHYTANSAKVGGVLAYSICIAALPYQASLDASTPASYQMWPVDHVALALSSSR